jgi:DNA-binding transcriptional regulator YiaG
MICVLETAAGTARNQKHWSEAAVRTAEQRSDLDQRLRGLSRRTLAESLGMYPGTLQGWEAGEHKPV